MILNILNCAVSLDPSRHEMADIASSNAHQRSCGRTVLLGLLPMSRFIHSSLASTPTTANLMCIHSNTMGKYLNTLTTEMNWRKLFALRDIYIYMLSIVIFLNTYTKIVRFALINP